MRYLKYFLAVLLLAALAAGVALHLERESIARGIANDILAGSGLTVTDLSITRLRSNEIRFSRLVLKQDDGARYEFRDVHVPLSLPDTAVRNADIGRLNVYPAPASGEPLRYADLLDIAFALPARFPDTTISVTELDWQGLPPLTELKWSTERDAQRLTASVAGVDLDLRASEVTGGHQLTVEGSIAGSGEPDLSARLTFRQSNPGYRADGSLRFKLDPWLDYASAPAPGSVESIGAPLSGSASIDAAIDVPAAGDVHVNARVSPDEGIRLAWAAEDGAVAAQVDAPPSIELDLQLPSTAWNLRTGPFRAEITQALARRIEASVESLACTPDECRLSGTTRAEDVDFDPVRAGAIEVTGAATVSLTGERRVIATVTTVSASGIEGGNWRIDTLRSSSHEDFHLSAIEGDVTAIGKRLTLDLAGLRAGDGLSGSARLHLAALEVSREPMALSVRFDLPKENLNLAWRDTPVVPARVEGDVDYIGEDGNARVTVSDPARDLMASLAVHLSKDRIAATVNDVSVGFGATPLSGSVTDWTKDWDLVGGRGRASGSVEWRAGDDGGSLAAEGRVELEDVAAAWNDIGATGIRASLPIRLTPDAAVIIGPGTVGAALVDVGLPLQDVAAEVEWDMASPEANVRGLSLGILGGKLTAEPFDFDLDDVSTALEFEVDAVQLGLIPQLADFEALEVTGALSGKVPVRVDGGTVTVDAGHLENVPPGGVIRYRTSLAPDSGSGLAMAQRALSNLQYQSLSSDVTYTTKGDLVMKLRLEGVNPDLDPLQPVILNLSIENNIPQLLKSLQATRDIQDIIESRTLKAPGKP